MIANFFNIIDLEACKKRSNPFHLEVRGLRAAYLEWRQCSAFLLFDFIFIFYTLRVISALVSYLLST